MIGVAAEMAGMHPQTLRMYERRGLVRPGRTKGRTRLYSQADLDRLRRIQALGEAGMNLAGIERVLDLERQLDRAT
ncbi:MAG: MerR family transcriptional regulator, partial [Thermoleophilia bacterium]